MTVLAHIGGPLGCLGLALLLVARARGLRLLGLGAWAVGALLLALFLVPSGHQAVLAAAAVAGLAAAAAGAVALRRWPWALAFLTLLLIPARIPISVGSTDAMLLLPLYLVVAMAAIGLARELWRGDGRSRELGPLALPLAAFVAWTGITLSWTQDLTKGAVALLFFFLPFGLLALALARLPWRPRLLPRLYLQLAGMGLLLALIGIYQYAAHDVFWNPKVIVGNAYQPFYRVNSLFWDPSIYGRFLVVAILASLVVAVRGPTGRARLVAAAVLAVTWVGLLFSFSQSSFIALLVAGVVAGAVLLRPRAGALAGAVALLAVVAVAGTPGPARTASTGASSAASSGVAGLTGPVLLADATSGRGKLVREGIRIALNSPVGGVGVGGFVRAYADRVGLNGRDPKRAASHTSVVTVAAEEGAVGLALLIWLGVAALGLPFRRVGRSTAAGLASLVLGLTLVAISVHSLGYNALFEDPMLWAALGLVAGVARAGGDATAAGEAAAGEATSAAPSPEPAA